MTRPRLTDEQVAALDRITADWDVLRDGPAPRWADLARHLDAGDGGGRRIVPRVLSGVDPTRTRWAWDARMPLGAVTLLAGRQGLGKSTLLAHLTAGLTRGTLDGDLSGEPVTVLIVSYEDDYASTTVPRLIAAGANLDLVVGLDLLDEDGHPGLLSLPGDLDLIAATAQEYRARALLIDPLMAGLGSGVDSHRDQDVRRALAPLGQLAADADLAVLAVLHLRKAGAGDALDRVSGSVAFTAAARSVLAFGARDDGDGDGAGRVLAAAKCNLGPLAPSLGYLVEPVTVHHGDLEIPTSKLSCDGEIDLQAAELLSPAPVEDRSEVEVAADWLVDHLADGEWHATANIREAAKVADIAPRTLQRASKRIGVESDRRAPEGATGRGSAVGHWRLPIVAPAPLARLSRQDSGAAIKPLGNAGSVLPEQLPRQDAHAGATTDPDAVAATPDEEAEAERIAAKLGVSI